MASGEEPEENAQEILAKYRQMTSECQQITGKIGELNLDKDEHKLVDETLDKLEESRKAYRLIGGVLVETKVGEIAPLVKDNLKGIVTILEKLDGSLKEKDEERKTYKEKHGIMTQEERDNEMKRQQRQAEREAQVTKAAKA
jgi:prefoldin subunit 2